MRTEIIPILKKEVEQTFGRRIVSSRDCIQLSEEIFNKIGYKINSNTLRRLFGLVKSIYLPSHATLTMLAKYCGFNSVEELSDLNIKEESGEQHISQNIVLNFLISLFKEINTNDAEATYRSIITQVIFFLDRNPQLADKLQREIAKTKFGQEYYFERSVHVDKLNDYYGDGLRYYMNEKQTDESKLFAYSLLVFRYWLTRNEAMLIKSFQAIPEYKAGKSIHPRFLGRYFAAHLFHAHVTGRNTEEILAEAQKHHTSLKNMEGREQPLPHFEHLLSEALILTGHYQEGLEYVRYVSERVQRPEDQDKHYIFQKNNVLEAIALSKLGAEKDANLLLNRISSAQFSPFSKKFYTILYLHLAIELKRREEGYITQLRSLIESTGFLHLYQLGRTELNSNGLML